MASPEDQHIPCQEHGCSEIIVFTPRDQEFYQERGWNPPKRCKAHRAEKKRRIAEKQGSEE